MTNRIQSIPIDKLLAHPDNPNRMSKVTFAKLVRNIERTGRYEPLVVRAKGDSFQIINGHHRWEALKKLGYKSVDAVVWDVDDNDTRILLATLNRLCGSDVLDKKLALLKRLSQKMQAGELAKLLPQTARQIERLTNLKMPTAPSIQLRNKRAVVASPMVFFMSDKQKETLKRAISLAAEGCSEKTRAAKNAAALTHIVKCYIQSNG